MRGGKTSSASKIDEFCRKNGFISWFETSARDNSGIEAAVRALFIEVTTFSLKYQFIFPP